MYQNKAKSFKALAISLRKKGMSYAEIKSQIFVSKSTLSSWFKTIELSEAQKLRLDKKQARGREIGVKKKNDQSKQLIQDIEKTSLQDIKEISKRELWLIGIILYWRVFNENNLKKGVKFTSSDPYLIKLFLKWLLQIGQLNKKEIVFDIFAGVNQTNKIKAIEYWSKVTGFSKESFKNLYILKNNKNSNILNIRVRASSMLARQLSGWIKAIQKNI